MIKLLPFFLLVSCVQIPYEPPQNTQIPPTVTATPIATLTATATATAAATEAPFVGWETFITDSRRQTQQLPKQMYALIPNEIKKNWAYVFCSKGIPKEAQNVVLFQNLVGFQDAFYPDWAIERHNREIKCIEDALKNNPDKRIIVQVTQGDSTNREFSLKIRAQLQERINKLTDKYGASRAIITYGADEQAVQAMAYSLGSKEVDVIISNPAAPQHYDGDRPAKELVAAKLKEMNLVQKAGSPFKVLLLTRRPGADSVDFQSNDEAQLAFDAKFLAENPITETTAIVDARLYNGAWDARVLPKKCDYLAFGGWGTFGNSFGSTTAIAKILLGASKETRQKLLLEAIGHDVFFQGYEEFQRSSAIASEFKKQGIAYSHYSDYSKPDLAKAYSIANTHVNQKMTQLLGACMGDQKIVLSPQRPKLFEAISDLTYKK